MDIPSIMTMVLAVFLSPALPDGMIEVGETSCQEAKAILQKQNLRLVDTEFLTGLDTRVQLLVEQPRVRFFAVNTLSYERMGAIASSGGFTTNSFFKKKSPPRAGFILCGLFMEELTPDDK